MDDSPQTGDAPFSIGKLILVPSLITLAVTLLRLVGELLNWSPGLFSKDAGGGGSLVGIAWLVPIFGVYFAVKLVKAGDAPTSAWKLLGLCVAAMVLMFATGAAADALKLPQLAVLLAFCALSLVLAWVAVKPWPALGRTLFAYAMAARIPVAVIMLIAMFGNWGTHYDVAPPNWPEIDAWNPFLKWIVIGLLPQVTIWIAYTLVVGGIFGAVTALVMRKARPAPDLARA